MSYTVLASTQRQARKAHRCNWCALAIDVGCVHLEVRAVYYGHIQVTKAHLPCEDLAMRYGEYFALSEDDWAIDWHEVLRWQAEDTT